MGCPTSVVSVPSTPPLPCRPGRPSSRSHRQDGPSPRDWRPRPNHRIGDISPELFSSTQDWSGVSLGEEGGEVGSGRETSRNAGFAQVGAATTSGPTRSTPGSSVVVGSAGAGGGGVGDGGGGDGGGEGDLSGSSFPGPTSSGHHDIGVADLTSVDGRGSPVRGPSLQWTLRPLTLSGSPLGLRPGPSSPPAWVSASSCRAPPDTRSRRGPVWVGKGKLADGRAPNSVFVYLFKSVD